MESENSFSYFFLLLGTKTAVGSISFTDCLLRWFGDVRPVRPDVDPFFHFPSPSLLLRRRVFSAVKSVMHKYGDGRCTGRYLCRGDRRSGKD